MKVPNESDPREVRRAPAGKLRMCYVDPRDGWATPEVDIDSEDEARQLLADMWGPRAVNMVVYDEYSEAVVLYH